MAGEWYDCHDPFFLRLKARAHRLLMRYNAMPYDDKENKYALLCQMLGSVGRDVSVGHAFTCDYGRNIHIGNNVSVNTGCTFVDCNRIDIGSNVLIGPNVAGASPHCGRHPLRAPHIRPARNRMRRVLDRGRYGNTSGRYHRGGQRHRRRQRRH